MGGELLTRCDELWVMGSAIFSGMREEMELAKKLYMPIFYVSDEMVQDKVKIRQQDRLLGLDDCVEGSNQSGYEGQILVLKPEAYGSSMDLTADGMPVTGLAAFMGPEGRRSMQKTCWMGGTFTGSERTFTVS